MRHCARPTPSRSFNVAPPCHSDVSFGWAAAAITAAHAAVSFLHTRAVGTWRWRLPAAIAALMRPRPGSCSCIFPVGQRRNVADARTRHTTDAFRAGVELRILHTDTHHECV